MESDGYKSVTLHIQDMGPTHQIIRSIVLHLSSIIPEAELFTGNLHQLYLFWGRVRPRLNNSEEFRQFTSTPTVSRSGSHCLSFA